jgi:hypothetical protein
MGVSKGLLDNPLLTEASGLAASIANPGMFWINNDSGDEPRIYLIDSTAKLKAIVTVKGIKNRDWEDLAIGKGPDPNLNYVYIGEIGDNKSKYGAKHIYRIAEFKIPILEGVLDTVISKVDHLKVELPNGQRDAEALLVDPISNNLFLFSKREKEISVYEIENWPAGDQSIDAKFLRKVPLTQITSADISRDGTELLLRNYNDIYYWKRDVTKPLIAVFERSGRVLPYSQEPQGESISFTVNDDGYYTVSEFSDGKIPHLLFYKRKESKEIK